MRFDIGVVRARSCYRLHGEVTVGSSGRWVPLPAQLWIFLWALARFNQIRLHSSSLHINIHTSSSLKNSYFGRAIHKLSHQRRFSTETISKHINNSKKIFKQLHYGYWLASARVVLLIPLGLQILPFSCPRLRTHLPGETLMPNIAWIWNPMPKID